MPKRTKPTPPEKAQTLNFWLAPIIILAGLVRLYNLDAIAIWHNEAVTAAVIRLPWLDLFRQLAADSIAPLFYILEKPWGLVFGTSIVALRLLPGLLGLVAVYAIFMFVRSAFAAQDSETPGKAERLALLAALLLAISPLAAQYSQSAQPHAAAVLLALTSAGLLVQTLSTGRISHGIYYSIAIGAGTYTSDYFLPALLAQAFYIGYLAFRAAGQPAGNTTGKAAMSLLLGAILGLPQLYKLASGLQAYSLQLPGFWNGAETVWKTMFAGVGTNRIAVSLGLLLVAVAVTYFVRSIKSEAKWLVLSSWLLPLLTALFITRPSEIDLAQSLPIASAFLAVILASVIFSMPTYSGRRILAVTLTAFTLLMFFKNWHELDAKNLFFGRHENRKPGAAGAMRFVNDTARVEDKIFAGSPFLLFSIEYYNQTGIEPSLYAPDALPDFLGQGLAQDRIVRDFGRAAKNDTAWVIWSRGFAGGKPIVPGNWEIIEEKYYADTPAFKGLIVVSEYHVD